MGYNEKFLEDIKKNQLGLDGTFEFGCNQCGKCCRNRDKENLIILPGYDVFRIAQALNLEAHTVIEKYCFMYLGDSKLPIVALKMRSGDNTCPFLRQGKCTIQQSKPLSCALYPLGRMLDSRTNEYTYFKQNVHCGNKEKHTVREWLDQWGIRELDEVTKEWGKAIVDLATYCLNIKDSNTLMMTQKAIAGAFYVYYDTKKDYVEQLRNNIETLKKIMPGFGVKQ